MRASGRAVLMGAYAAVTVLTLVLALTTRDWVGLEEVLVVPLVVGVGLGVTWIAILAAGLLRGRAWASTGAVCTFGVAGAVSLWVAWGDPTNPLGAALLVLAVAIVVAARPLPMGSPSSRR